MGIYHWFRSAAKRLLLAALPLVIPCSVIADETEIFYQSDAAKVNSNVLFLLDASGSMDQTLPGSGGQTRMQVMKETFREVMDTAPDNLNIGLMHYANANFISSYQRDSIKGVNFPISALNDIAESVIGSYSAIDNLPDAATGTPVRSFLADVVDSWEPAGYTPIVDSLYEAARYFRGEESVWGKYPPAYNWAAHPASYTGTPVCENPTTEECRLEWGECNGTQTACATKPINSCCNWVEDASGGFCVDNDYSCSIDINHCTHTLCSGVSGNVTYKTPIEYSCQSNFLVLMSDGKPEYPYYSSRTADGTGQYAKSAFPDLVQDSFFVPALTPPVSSAQIPNAIPSLVGTTCADQPSGYASGTCGPELTSFLSTQDQSGGLAGQQTVETFTVAFGMAGEPAGTAYLASLATENDGAYTADNSEELAAALKDVFGDIEKKAHSFSSPSFSVSEDNLLANGSDVYLPVFNSSRTPLWSGNLRKFELSQDNKIQGAGGSNVLTATGEFTTGAQDLWSGSPHGESVIDGGAASKLPLPGNRIRRTDANGNTLVAISSATPASDIPPEMLSPDWTRRTDHDLKDIYIEATGLLGQDGLSRVGWYIDCDGNTVTVGTLLNPGTPVNIEAVTTCSNNIVITEEKRKILLDFARGYAVNDAGEIDTSVVAGRQHIGDALNSKPIVVNYGTKELVFLATNEGYLHAFNADSGIEEWAFMPSTLLKNQLTFFENAEVKKHVYGLDGPLTLWNEDVNKNGVIDSGDKRVLFFGMRRGGYMYYAMDITNPDAPQILWKISPGSSSDFSNLGETWSKPTLSKMRVAGASGSDNNSKHVLVFGGGYDPEYDKQNPGERAHVISNGSAKGSDVYIVDAKTGALIWSAQDQGGTIADKLKHSVAGDIRVLDMDNNGELDRLYFADLGGNIWRVDVGMDVTTGGGGVQFSNKITLTQLAQLGGTGTDGDHRKFFYEPDTALRMRGGETIMTVSIGSGYRTHPLDLGDNDNFYVLLDHDAFGLRDPNEAVIKVTDLVEANADGSGLVGGGSILDDPTKKGWYIDMQHRGEKVLSTSLTFLDKILFTTFAQANADGSDSIAGPCSPLVMTSRAYVLDLLTGAAVADLDRQQSASPTVIKEPFAVAGFGEILDAPQLIFSKVAAADGSSCTKGDCKQTVSVRVGKLDAPILDTENTLNADSADFNEMVDLTRLLPRLYWRDKELER